MSGWELSIGLYPGILLGARSYPSLDFIEHVLYIPFVEIILTVYMNKIEEYLIKNYPTRFKQGDDISIEERDKHIIAYIKDGSPVFLSKKILE